MKISVLLIIATAALFSCTQASRSTPETVDIETVHSVRKYEYADSMGKHLIIQNSFPKGGQRYKDPNGNDYVYAVFWTRITNETVNPIELKIDFPLDSFEIPSSSGIYMKLLLPSDTMTIDKELLYDYGLTVKSFLDNNRHKSSALKRTINSNDSTAFYVVAVSNRGVDDGVLRTGFSLKGLNLLYKIFAYKSTPEHPLMNKKEIDCGSINLKNLVLQK